MNTPSVRLSGPKRRVVQEHCVRTLDDFVKENRGFLSKNTLENASYCGPLSEKSIKVENVRVVLKILQVSIHTTDLSFSSFFHQKIYNIGKRDVELYIILNRDPSRPMSMIPNPPLQIVDKTIEPQGPPKVTNT